MKLRVCNVEEEGRFGGPAHRIIQVAKTLLRYGIDTHVVYPKLDSERFAEEISKAGIKGSAIDITRLSREKRILVRYILLFPIEVLRLFRFLRNRRFDLVHVNGSYQFKVALAAKFARVPVVWHLNDTSMNRIVKVICIIVARYCASGFIFAGKRVRDYYSVDNKLNHRPFAEIHAPVDTKAFDSSKVRPDNRYDQYHGTKIVTVSGLHPIKGLEYYIEMASRLYQSNKDIVFLIAGAKLASHKKYYDSLEKQILSTPLSNKNLIFLGLVDNVPSLLHAADIFVFTSIAEASPTAVWEAMSMAKAVVTTDVGSVREYIVDGDSGFIVPIRDVEALSRKVQYLLDCPEAKIRMGEKAREVAQKKLDLSMAAEKHADIYRDVCLLHT